MTVAVINRGAVQNIPDVIEADAGDDSISIYIGNGNGTFIPRQEIVSVGADPTSFLFAPLANDGALDLAIANAGGSTVSVYLNDLNGNLAGPLYTIANQPPSGTSATVSTYVNLPYTFRVADFGFTDPNHPPNTLQAVAFTTLPNAGVITDNGIALSAGQFVSVADISAGNLVFTPNSNLVGGPYFLCLFQVESNGTTTNGGQNLDPNPKVLDIHILKVNQSPSGLSRTLVVTGAREIRPTFSRHLDAGFTRP